LIKNHAAGRIQALDVGGLEPSGPIVTLAGMQKSLILQIRGLA
jgi:hypothetical protein